MPSRSIVLSAAYGMGNIGDEAICDALLGDIFAVNPDAFVTVLAWSPSTWKKAHPGLAENTKVRVAQCLFVRSQWASPRALFGFFRTIWTIARCDAFLWGGGGIVRDRTYWLRGYLWSLRVARFFRRRIAVVGIGVDRIESQEVKSMLGVLTDAEAVTVRDPQSAENLQAAVPGLTISDVIRDPVFHYPVSDHQSSGSRTIALNLCNRDGANTLNDEFNVFADHLARVLAALHQEKPISLIGVPTDPRDELFIRHVASLVPSIPFSLQPVTSPSAYIDAVRRTDLLLGMRMHGIILGAGVAGLPVAGFLYSKKVEELVHASGASGDFFPFGTFDTETAVTRFRRLLDEPAVPAFAAHVQDSLRIRAFLTPFLA